MSASQHFHEVYVAFCVSDCNQLHFCAIMYVCGFSGDKQLHFGAAVCMCVIAVTITRCILVPSCVCLALATSLTAPTLFELCWWSRHLTCRQTMIFCCELRKKFSTNFNTVHSYCSRFNRLIIIILYIYKTECVCLFVSLPVFCSLCTATVLWQPYTVHMVM